MKYTQLQNLTKNDVAGIIDFAWRAEATRDIEGAIANFAPIWSNIELDPDFREFENTQQADLYRLCGYFLSFYGKAKNLKSYQERGKNLITKAIAFFTQFNNLNKVAEAQNTLALCYYLEGSILEAELILEQTALDLLKDHLEYVYFQNRNNLLLAKFSQKKYSEAIEIIDEIKISIEFCNETRTRSVFHEKAGLIYRGINQFDKAVWHYNQAIQYAYLDNNLLFVSSINNNLAFLYYKLYDFQLAHQFVNEAIRVAQKNNFIGWLPTFLDTKALIFAGEGNLKLALNIIEEALEILLKSDDYLAITDSMWNKCKFLFQLNRSEDAILTFSELISIARQRMGEFAVKNFVKEFKKLIHIKQEGSLNEELNRFKRVEIVNAIQESNNNLQNAAELLKLDSEEFTNILENEFPEIYQEFNIQPITPVAENIVTQSDNSKLSSPRKISRLQLEDFQLTDKQLNKQNISTYFVSAEILSEKFGIKNDLILAVEPVKTLKVNEFLLAYNESENVYLFGKCQYEKDLDLYYLVDKDEPIPLSLDEKQIIGRAIEYLPFSEIDSDCLQFSPLNF